MTNQPDLSGAPPTTGKSASFDANVPPDTSGSLRTGSSDGLQPSLTSPSTTGAASGQSAISRLLDAVNSLLPAENRRLPTSKWDVVALANQEALGIVPKLPLLEDESILESITKCIRYSDYFETYFLIHEEFRIEMWRPLGQSTLGAVWQSLSIGLAGVIGLSGADQGISTTWTVRDNLLRITDKCVCQLNNDDSPYALLTLIPKQSTRQLKDNSSIDTQELAFEWKRLPEVVTSVPPES